MQIPLGVRHERANRDSSTIGARVAPRPGVQRTAGIGGGVRAGRGRPVRRRDRPGRDPGYSHLRHAISELTASAAPHRAVLAPLYIAYNVVLVGFAVGLARAWPRRRLLRLAVLLFAVAGMSGVAQVTVFPQASTGTAAAAAGVGHIVLAGVSAF
jgi:hypothetical protein